MRRLRSRIAASFVVLLATVEAAGFWMIDAANDSNARLSIDQHLASGELVFQRLLEHQRSDLTQAAGVLAADYAFREAVATRDLPTVTSALANHGARIDASVATLISPEDVVLADTANAADVGRPFRFPRLVAAARRSGEASGIVLLGGKPYQLVVVPMYAPRLIAWVALGFVVDDRLARDLRHLSGLQVSFAVQRAPGPWNIHASTLPPQARPAIGRLLEAHRGQGDRIETTLADEPLVTRVTALTSESAERVVAVLQASLAQARQGYDRLRNVLVLLAGSSLAISIVASLLVARSIARPLSDLTVSAGRMRDGDYSVSLDSGRGDEIGVLASSLDHMRERVADRERKILRLAFVDPLTGLPNRAGFGETAAVELARCAADGAPCAVVVVDLDRFRQINDVLGHDSGDLVLAAVAERIARALPAGSTLARLAADEFAFLLPGSDAQAAGAVTRAVAGMLEAPFVIADQPVDVRASFGIALSPDHGDNAAILVRRADVAMQTAKRANVGRSTYDPTLETAREEHLSLLGALQRAVERNELRTYFQPKVDLARRCIVGVEALMRWSHPDRGFVPPGEFIPFAEQTGYIRVLTRWVLNDAIAQAAQWYRRGLRLRLSVNTSARDLSDADFPLHLRALLERHGLPPGLLCLEVTESSIMDDPRQAIAILQCLRDLGVKLSIDDFGTGYSSLAYLKRLPVDELKIDRAFVSGVATDARDAAIVRSTVELAHSLGLTVVAEGIEDAATVQCLVDAGCDEAQGFHFARPQPADALLEWIATSPWGLPAQPDHPIAAVRAAYSGPPGQLA